MFDPYTQFFECVVLGIVFGINWSSERWYMLALKWISRPASGVIVGILFIRNLAQHYNLVCVAVLIGFILGAKSSYGISSFILDVTKNRDENKEKREA